MIDCIILTCYYAIYHFSKILAIGGKQLSSYLSIWQLNNWSRLGYIVIHCSKLEITTVHGRGEKVVGSTRSHTRNVSDVHVIWLSDILRFSLISCSNNFPWVSDKSELHCVFDAHSARVPFVWAYDLVLAAPSACVRGSWVCLLCGGRRSNSPFGSPCLHPNESLSVEVNSSFSVCKTD